MDLTAPAASRDAPRPGGGAYLWLMSCHSLAGRLRRWQGQRGQRKCQTRPVRSDAMPLDALDDSGQPVRVLEGGPRRASCAECGAPMRARTGSVRIWHWRTWCTTRAARRPGKPNGTWPGRCWPGRAVALRGIELVHSLGRRPSVNMDGITLCGIGVTGTHAAPPIWTGGDSSAIASRGAQIGLFRAPASPGSAEMRAVPMLAFMHRHA